MIETLLILLLILVFFLSVLMSIIIFKRSDQQKESANQLLNMEKNLERVEKTLKEEISQNREESNVNAKMAREELGSSLKAFNDSLLSRMTDIATLQKNQLEIFSRQLGDLTQRNEEKLEKMRMAVEEKLRILQEDNNKKIEQMRVTVDEKLQSTLEARLSDSFRMVSERLEQVHKGLGEMQVLASGVSDLKKVLTNVKVRGTMGEVQLGALLEQILTREQYAKNVATKKGSSERVEFAIKMPGKEGAQGCLWLPIDAKFPMEDYQRLMEAYEQADPVLCENAAKQLENRIKSEAKDIKEKYIDPPGTTDFGILFLPIEGLYAEVLRRTGLYEHLMREYRVIITGPTTLGALLNSLQMGFRTLAIEKRSSEVWELLSIVKTEFMKFGEILEKTHKKLREASDTIESAAKKTKTIQKKLKDVQELPSGETIHLIEEPEEETEKSEEEKNF